MKRRFTLKDLGIQESGGLSALFKAIGDPTRQEILLMLERHERSVNEIVEHFQLSQPTISRHLAVLHQAGLISRRRDGQRVVYSLKPESVKCCCEGFFGHFDCCSPFFGTRHSHRRKPEGGGHCE
jgi:ArsR family transcriptional regulator